MYVLDIKQGSSLVASLTIDSKGNLYGTSMNGGNRDFGSVFELSPATNAAPKWIPTVIHSFGHDEDGIAPWDQVILDQAGNVFGTTRDGGPAGGGIVFELTPDSRGDWMESILYRFTLKSGGEPYDAPAFDQAGNLYGAASTAGGPPCNCGAIFELQHTSTGWKETALHRFQGTDGSTPVAGLVFDAKGNLYGTTQEGGAHSSGTVFQLAPDSNGHWTHTILYDFPQFKNGSGPVTTLVFDKAGNLYGTAAGGIETCSGGCGVGLQTHSRL